MPNNQLDILICSLYERSELLKRLCSVLSPQCPEGVVGIKTECDNREMSIGNKRNKLLESSEAEYICFVDDDDRVALDYVARILEALKQKPDCVGIEGIITFNGHNPRKFIHSKRYSSWHEKDGIYLRCPNHLNPVKRELALKVKFPDSSHGEDGWYSGNLYHLLQSEVYIDGPIYFYDYKDKK